MTMFGSIYRFELRYHLTRPITWLYYVLFVAGSFAFVSTDTIAIAGGSGMVMRNAPSVIVRAMFLIVVLGQIVVSGLVGSSVLRDYQVQAHELVFTTPISRFAYLGGRFLGAFTVMVACGFSYFEVRIGPVTVIGVAAPGDSGVPRVHATSWPVTVQVQPVPVAAVGVSPAGMVSLTRTPVAIDGPRLSTANVKVATSPKRGTTVPATGWGKLLVSFMPPIQVLLRAAKEPCAPKQTLRPPPRNGRLRHRRS